ncbi:MAG: thiamine pyrophosphate-dependent enzyme [Myxococcota bacterium]
MSPAAPPPRVAAPPGEAPEDAPPDLGLFRVLDDDGRRRAVEGSSLSPARALEAYRYLRLMRLLDARMVLLQRQGRVGFYGTCTGQEAVPVGVALALRADDWVFPALREGAIMLVRGVPLATYLAQVFGRGGDVLKGRMQPSHMAAREVHFVSWSSNIGTQLPHAVGAAMAARIQGRDDIAVGFVGDGGTSSPDFHVAMHAAAHHRAPCVLICQNNQFAISARPWHQTASETYAIKGRAYGVPSIRIDGNDLLAVHQAVADAAARARRGDGPTFVEAITYRIGPHSTADDPGRYRAPEEVAAWMARDPITVLRRHLQHLGALDPSADEAIERELNAEISAAVAVAEAQPAFDRATMFDDVYARVPVHLQAQRAEERRGPRTADDPGAHGAVAHGADDPAVAEERGSV